MRDADGLKYMLTDHLGSVVAVTDEDGDLLQQTRYIIPFGDLPFGLPRTDVPSISMSDLTDFTYTGQRALDAQNNTYSLGLMDYRARFYDPYLHRFAQPDTIVPGAGNPQAWNRYAYVLGNPLRYVDPSGHAPICDEEGNCYDRGLGSYRGTRSDVAPDRNHTYSQSSPSSPPASSNIPMCLGSSTIDSGSVETGITIYDAIDIGERNLSSRAEESNNGQLSDVVIPAIDAIATGMSLAEDFGSQAPPRYHIGINVAWIYDAAGFRISQVIVNNDSPTILAILSVDFTSAIERLSINGPRDAAYSGESINMSVNYTVSPFFTTTLDIKILSAGGCPDYPMKTIIIPISSTSSENWNIIPSVFGE